MKNVILPSHSNPLRIVVVGSGDSSRYVLSYLNGSKNNRSKMHITIIRPHTFCEVDYYATYACTRPNEYDANSTLTPPKGADEVIHGQAVSMKDRKLYFRPLSTSNKISGEMKDIPFDIIVAATGSTIPFVHPVIGQSLSDRKIQIKSFLQAISRTISKSDDGKDVYIVLEGGGTVGVELAGDVLEAMGNNSQKRLILVSGSNRLVTDQSNEISAKIQARLENMGAKIIFHNSVVSHSESKILAEDEDSFKITLKDGKTIQCVALVKAFSTKGPNTQWIQGNFDGVDETYEESKHDEAAFEVQNSILNQDRKINVNSYLQSSVYPRLYAIGSVSTFNAPVTVPNIEHQAKTIANNIIAAAKYRSFEHQAKHKPLGILSDAPLYIKVGHEQFVHLVPEHLPAPIEKICFHWCGYPCNLFCIPCFGCGTLCGLADPMICGYCCDGGKNTNISAKGLAKTMMSLKNMNILAQKSGYHDLGSTALDNDSSVLQQKMLR